MDDQNEVDVIIVGAGAAGLAAARDLSDAGLRIAVIEARGRVGGRVFTYRDPRSNAPIELGAEFLHGATPETDAVIEQARISAYEVMGDRWRAKDGRLKPVGDYWQKVDRVMRSIDGHRTPDQSFEQYLDTHLVRPKYARDKRLAFEFVQGFHAADVSRISERSLAEGGDPGEDPTSERMGRVLEGYDRVTAWLARQVFDSISINTVVDRITWERGRAQVNVRSTIGRGERTISAAAVIITVPIGVLQADAGTEGAIEFVPDVPEVRGNVAGIAMGSVCRVILTFKERFWEKARRLPPKGSELGKLSFIHGRGTDFPVWWSMFPLRLPVLVGWAGGPPAGEVAQNPDDALQERAILSLAHHLGVGRDRLASLVTGFFTHNWQDDPYSRGAYSYAVVGGADAGARLAQPIEATLFFAGEATASGGHTATVEGALASGRRAAQDVLTTLS